jgi:hypothetical protein
MPPLTEKGADTVPEVVDFHDDFDGPGLDEAIWFPHYLPAWSSRRATAAVHAVQGSCLVLSIPPDRGLWCPEDHPEPLRVSGVQSGSWSGPEGSTRGQQRFRDGLVVRERQPRLTGWLPCRGEVSVRCRMELSPRSMAAMWLSGFEEDPADAGELCVVEVFGRSVHDGSADVGVGVKQVGDARLVQQFAAPRLRIDVAEMHEYVVEWDDREAEFRVDGTVVHTAVDPPTYPMQAMLAVFDFPAWSGGGDEHLVPRLVVDSVTGRSGER